MLTFLRHGTHCTLSNSHKIPRYGTAVASDNHKMQDHCLLEDIQDEGRLVVGPVLGYLELQVYHDPSILIHPSMHKACMAYPARSHYEGMNFNKLGWGFQKPGSTQTHSQVSSPNQPINLASAVQVSIDTAIQSCEVKKGGGGKDGVEMSPVARDGHREGKNTHLQERRTQVLGTVLKMHLWLALACKGDGRCGNTTETP